MNIKPADKTIKFLGTVKFHGSSIFDFIGT